MSVIEINEMIDLLEEFFNNSNDSDMEIVGGIAGSPIFKIVTDAALTRYKFERILIVTGCQDYVGITKDVLNYVFYADLFMDVMCDPITPYDPFKPSILNPKPEYHCRLKMSLLNNYDCIIIDQAQLIPSEYVNMITRSYFGKKCYIVDQYDICGVEWTSIGDVPTITDSLEKLSPMIAMARATYNIDTRAVDRSIKGGITETKISKRSIGKIGGIDDKHYISDDPELIDIVRQKQSHSQLRRNHKLLVVSNRIHSNINEGLRSSSVTKNSLLSVVSANASPLMRLRIYLSDTIYSGEVTYLDPQSPHLIKVVPANILSITESAHHRYKTAVLICRGHNLSRMERYSIIKNSNNLIVGYI